MFPTWSSSGSPCLLFLLGRVVGLQVVAYGRGVLSQIEDPIDDDHVVLDEVVDSKGKSSGKETIISERFRVSPSAKQQRIDVREERVQEVSADSLPVT